MLKLEGDWGVRPDQRNMNKSQYFKAMSGRRLLKIDEQLRLIRNQSNKRNYEYTEEDIQRIEDYLNTVVKKTIDTLRGEKEFTFKL